MDAGRYSKISGKKTLVLVAILIGIIILLSIYSVFMIVRRSSVVTNSINYEKSPSSVKKPVVTPTPTNPPNQVFPVRHGD